MSLPRSRKKVKEKERARRKKRQIYSNAKRKKKRGKTQRGKKSHLVLNTKAKIKRLEKQLAAEKKKSATLRKWKKRPKRSRRRKPEPGALLSERSEAAKRGWTTRRAKATKELGEFLQAKELSPEDQQQLRKFARQGAANQKQLIATYVKKLPDYLIRKDKEEFLVERKENLIMHRLIIAKEITGDFDAVAYDMADEYDLEPYEIYSLWHGYELEE